MTVQAHHIVPEPPDLENPPYPADIFAGRTVLVSGGGSGMGLAMAKAFAQGGAKVGIHLGRGIDDHHVIGFAQFFTLIADAPGTGGGKLHPRRIHLVAAGQGNVCVHARSLSCTNK